MIACYLGIHTVGFLLDFDNGMISDGCGQDARPL